jgi:hypothetical protein
MFEIPESLLKWTIHNWLIDKIQVLNKEEPIYKENPWLLEDEKEGLCVGIYH